jgi:predicted nucleic acid-binding protein
VIYLDSSAMIKVVNPEPQSNALRAWLRRQPGPFVSSTLLEVEVRRALWRINPAVLADVSRALAPIEQVPIDPPIINVAGRFPEPLLRSLDAIHLATAVVLASSLTFVTYDKQLATVAAAMGFGVTAPA